MGYAETLVETRYEHIVLNEDHVSSIASTIMKVVVQHPCLTLGQIHSALAYYWDHREELDRDMQRRLKRVEELHRRIGARI